jgi:hypothetical protein
LLNEAYVIAIKRHCSRRRGCDAQIT